ncbi:MAG: ABC transporter substrate-binding protein [Myxococcota bacterium]|nr:ABC transporter substrate-binding protein [Myxococcota bacterium]
MKVRIYLCLLLTSLLSVYGCTKPKEQSDTKKDKTAATAGQTKAAETTAAAKATATAKPAEAAKTLKVDKGVDVKAKKIKIAILNDQSGPAAVIGRAFGAGKRILAAQINGGQSKLLPEGWTVELVEKDHGYNPGKAQQAFDSLKNDVLFVGLSFGTPTTLPLRPFLEKETIIAYPASLSSLMAGHENTPPAGPSYMVEASRAMDWIVKDAGGADKVKAAIIYQQDDYGKDALAGLKAAADKHAVQGVIERALKPGQKDVTAELTALKNAGVNYIYLAVLPSSTGPVLGTAAAMKFMPKWVGATPAWLDVFFAHPKLPPAVFTNFYWATGLPFWGEKVPGMDTFLAAFKAHGKGARPDFYLLMSYVQGLFSIEAARRAIEAGDITRAGYLKALRSIKGWSAGGLIQPVDMTGTPYQAGNQTRVLKPDFAKKTWTVVADYAVPTAN